MRISDWSSDVCSSDLIAFSARARSFSASGQPRFAIRKRESWSKEAPQLAVSRRHSITASPTELGDGGGPETDASPIWARYQAICSGVSSIAVAAVGMSRAAASAMRDILGSEIIPAIVIANSLRVAEYTSHIVVPAGSYRSGPVLVKVRYIFSAFILPLVPLF